MNWSKQSWKKEGIIERGATDTSGNSLWILGEGETIRLQHAFFVTEDFCLYGQDVLWLNPVTGTRMERRGKATVA